MRGLGQPQPCGDGSGAARASLPPAHTPSLLCPAAPPQNVFLVRENAERVIKIGDFGSARSARPQGYQSAPQAAPLAGALDLRPSCARMHVADSYDQMDKAMEVSGLLSGLLCRRCAGSGG